METKPTEHLAAAFASVAVRAGWGQVAGGRVAPTTAWFDVVERRRFGAAAIHAAVAPRIEDVLAKTPLGVTLVQQMGFTDPVVHWW